jgi:hypothetical protein
MLTDVTYIASELRVCYPFKFIREEQSIYFFAKPMSYPGKEYFQGCSGAPVVNMNGHLVGLVSQGFGNAEVTVVTAFPLYPYRSLFDNEVSNLVDQALSMVVKNDLNKNLDVAREDETPSGD